MPKYFIPFVNKDFKSVLSPIAAIAITIINLPPATKPLDKASGIFIKVFIIAAIIKNITKNCEYQAQGFPTFIEEIMKADGLVKQTRMNLSSNDKGK